MAGIAGTLWEHVALRRTRVGADPDAPLRSVALPVTWLEEEAAAALAALAPGDGPVSLPSLAERWIRRVTARGRRMGLLASPKDADRMAEALRALLLARRGAPGADTWRGAAIPPRPAASSTGTATPQPRFVLNLPAFLDAEGGFDAAAYGEAVALGVLTLEILANGRAFRLRLGFADLAGWLAGLGLAYDSEEGRTAAAALAALTRGAAEAESGRLAALQGAREPIALLWPAPPETTVVPGLAEAARAALTAAAEAPGLRHGGLVSLASADAVEALLGTESAGLAPAPGPTRIAMDAESRLVERPTAAARRAGVQAARLLAPVGEEARRAMIAAVTPFLHADPPRPVVSPAPARPLLAIAGAAANGAGPAANGEAGRAWRVSVGGHRVTLRTTEDREGRLLGIAFSLPREAPALRTLMEAFAQSVSVGLVGDVPLADYVRAFAYARIGPGGAVEGDPAIARATSILDWAFRRLALEYLGRLDLLDPAPEDCQPQRTELAGQPPLLPLELPTLSTPRRRRLRAAA